MLFVELKNTASFIWIDVNPRDRTFARHVSKITHSSEELTHRLDDCSSSERVIKLSDPGELLLRRRRRITYSCEPELTISKSKETACRASDILSAGCLCYMKCLSVQRRFCSVTVQASLLLPPSLGKQLLAHTRQCLCRLVLMEGYVGDRGSAKEIHGPQRDRFADDSYQQMFRRLFLLDLRSFLLNAFSISFS